MRRLLRIGLRLFGALAVTASLLAAWVFWPRPIEGFWEEPTPQCLCNGCRFLYFNGGRGYQFHENHGATYWGKYTESSRGVYCFTFDLPDTTPYTIYTYGLVSRWTEGGAPPATVWRLLSTTKPSQLLNALPIRTLDGRSVSLNPPNGEHPQSQATSDHAH